MSSPIAAPWPPAYVGRQARQWMRDHDWEASTDETFQISAASLERGPFVLSQIWHSPARLRRIPASGTGSVLVLIGVHGNASVRGLGRDWHLDAGQILVVDAHTPFSLTTSAASSRLEVRTERNRLGALQALLNSGIAVIDAEPRYWRTLATLIVTVLNAGISAEDAGFASLRSAIASAITATVVQASSRLAGPQSVARLSHLSRAARIIEERFHDPQFSASELARSLAVSSAHLHRIFESTAVTPYQAIQQRRVSRATELLRGSPAPKTTVAFDSGFSSTRAMRTALKRHARAAVATTSHGLDSRPDRWRDRHDVQEAGVGCR